MSKFKVGDTVWYGYIDDQCKAHMRKAVVLDKVGLDRPTKIGYETHVQFEDGSTSLILTTQIGTTFDEARLHLFRHCEDVLSLVISSIKELCSFEESKL
jgi:hypothetical protein